MPEEDQGSLANGLGIGCLLTTGGLILCGFLFALVGGVPLLAFGLLQVLWIGPALWHYHAEGKTKTIQGILIVAGICFLLSATCWGIIFKAGR